MAKVIIKKRDLSTVEQTIVGGILPMSQGDGVRLSSEGPFAIIAVDGDIESRSHFYQRNLKAIVDREDSAEFEFPGTDGYYVSRIQGVTPLVTENSSGIISDFAIVGGPTVRVGESTNTILLMDIGRPDVDCDDYTRLSLYINRVREVIDGIKGQILGDPTVTAGTLQALTYGVHKQYQAMQLLWNFLVKNLSLVVNVSYQENSDHGSSVFMQIRIHNNTSEEVDLSAISVALAANASANQYVTMRFSRVVKAIRTTDGARFTVSATSNIPGGSLSGSIKTGITWTLTPTLQGVGGDVVLQPDEVVSISAEFLLSTSITANLPNQFIFNVSTSIPNSFAEETLPITVARERRVFVPTVAIAAIITPP